MPGLNAGAWTRQERVRLTNWEAGLDTPPPHRRGETGKTPPSRGDGAGRGVGPPYPEEVEALEAVPSRNSAEEAEIEGEQEKAAEQETRRVGMQRWGRVRVLRWEELGDIYRLGGGTQEETEAETQKEKGCSLERSLGNWRVRPQLADLN